MLTGSSGGSVNPDGGAWHRVRQCSPEEAVRAIASGSTIAISGSGGGVNEPAAILAALERRFLATGEPRDLIVVHPNGLGDGHGGGTERFAHAGMVRRVYGSHWSWAPVLAKMAADGEIEAAIWPQGVIGQLLRAKTGRRPGLLTSVGEGTYLDRRVGAKPSGKMVLPELVTLNDQTWLHYDIPAIDVAIVRATTADADGNLSFEHEGAVLDALNAAQAAKVNGGLVVAQVKRVARAGSLDARMVRVPGYLVDVVAVDEHQRLSFETSEQPGLTGEIDTAVPERHIDRVERRIIAGRAVDELRPGMIVNLGFGIADGVASLAAERGKDRGVTFSVEQGASGGVPAWGADFGLMWNARAFIEPASLFDFYDGGGLDLTVLSFAEIDRRGNINVSRFGNRVVGPGGFMNISQGAKTVVFCGTFTTKGLKVSADGGRLRIDREGEVSKFVADVEEITFNAEVAARRGQRMLVVTERAVFEMTPDGLRLIEIAPGVDLERDVLAHMGFRPLIAEPLRELPAELFRSPESLQPGLERV